MEKKQIENLTPDERRQILEQARSRARREVEDRMIAEELAQQEAEAKAKQS